MDEKRKAARHELRRTAASKNAAQDAFQILSVISDGHPISVRRLFSSSSSSSSSLVRDNVEDSEVLQTATATLRPLLPKSSSTARHTLKSIAVSKNASNDVMELLPAAEATPSFRWLFPHFRSRSSSSSSLLCASSSSYRTCIQDEHVLNTDGDARSQTQESESHISSCSIVTLAEVDDMRISDNTNKEIATVKSAQGGIEGGASEANQPVAPRRSWLEGWRKEGREGSKMEGYEPHKRNYSVITTVDGDIGSLDDVNKDIIKAIERAQGGIEDGTSEVNQPVAPRRSWLEGWRKGRERSKMEGYEPHKRNYSVITVVDYDIGRSDDVNKDI